MERRDCRKTHWYTFGLRLSQLKLVGKVDGIQQKSIDQQRWIFGERKDIEYRCCQERVKHYLRVSLEVMGYEKLTSRNRPQVLLRLRMVWHTLEGLSGRLDVALMYTCYSSICKKLER